MGRVGAHSTASAEISLGLTSEVGPDGIDQGNKLRTVAHCSGSVHAPRDFLGPVDHRFAF